MQEINWKEVVLKEGSKLPKGEVATVLVLAYCIKDGRIDPDYLEILVEGKRRQRQIVEYALKQIQNWTLSLAASSDNDMIWIIPFRGDVRNRGMFMKVVELFRKPLNPTSTVLHQRIVKVGVMKKGKEEGDMLHFDEGELTKFGLIDSESETVH